MADGHSRAEARGATEKRTIHYACMRCGNCCRWPGFVRLTNRDITRIASFLCLSEEDFIQRYTQLTPSRQSLALISKPDDACIFLEGANTCRIQKAKPEQCEGFPNAWNFPGWRQVCEAEPIPASGETSPSDQKRVSPGVPVP